MNQVEVNIVYIRVSEIDDAYRINRGTSANTSLTFLFPPYRLYLESNHVRYMFVLELEVTIVTYVTGWLSLSVPFTLPTLPKISSENSSFTTSSTLNCSLHFSVDTSISCAAFTFSSLRATISRSIYKKPQHYAPSTKEFHENHARTRVILSFRIELHTPQRDGCRSRVRLGRECLSKRVSKLLL